VGTGDRNLSPAEWSEALQERFFPLGDHRRRRYLAVDDDVLDDLVGGPGRGAWSLVAAVRSQLRTREPRSLFEDVARSGFSWSAGRFQGPPPILPCLAVCVLAASRMDAGAGMSSTNYYERLREALELEYSPQTAYRDTVPAMFRVLHQWLEEHLRGSRGRSTIPAEPAPAHIGFALSQVFLRESDRRRLTRFFTAVGLAPTDAPSSSALIPELRAWTERSDLSGGAKRFIRDDQFHSQVVAMLEGELRDWDQMELDPEGRPVALARLLLRIAPRVEWGLYVARPQGFPSNVTFTGLSGIELALRASTDEAYDPVMLGFGESPLIAAALSSPVVLRSGRVSFRLSIDPVTPLGPDPDTGMLISRAHVRPGHRHWLLMRNDVRLIVEDYMRASAREGWTGHASGLRGWSLLRDVFIDLPPSTPIDPQLAALVPGVDARPELRGGLRVPGTTTHHRYLAGGEPDLWVPEWAAKLPDFVVKLDGRSIEPVAPLASRYRLSGRDLGGGLHRIQAGWLGLSFQLVDHIAEASWASTACQVVLLSPGLVPSSRDGVERYVCGATVHDPTVDPTKWNPVLLPYGATGYVLIGGDVGQVAASTAPARPPWLEQVGLIPQDFELFASFPVAWVRIDWPYAGAEFRQLSAAPPLHANASVDASREWASQLAQPGTLDSQASADAFAAYTRVAESILETSR
jgi:hypothetical protein